MQRRRLAGFKSVISRKASQDNPLISGPFYLAETVIIATLFWVIAGTVDIIVFPIAIIGTLLIVSTIGAFQLRQDAAFKEQIWTPFFAPLPSSTCFVFSKFDPALAWK
jgi:hypothetical protein